MRGFVVGGILAPAILFVCVGCASDHHESHPHPERETYLERHAPQPSPVYTPPPQRVVIVQQPPPDCAVVVLEAPPKYVEQERGPRPTKSHVWVEGYWARGRDGWVWVLGRWEKPPRSQAVWAAPHWERDGNEYHFRDGHWH